MWATKPGPPASPRFTASDDSIRAKTERVLREHPGRPFKAHDLVEALDPGVSGKRREALDRLIRSALSKALKRPGSGVKRAGYGRYVWEDPTKTNGAHASAKESADG